MISLHKSLRITGWFITLFGIIIGLGNLLGWFQSKSRKDFYQLVMKTGSGIPITHPAAQEFIKRFPPPAGFNKLKITHITKLVLATESGFPISGTLQYMNERGERSSDVATFEDVRVWTEGTNVGWIAWITIVCGWILVILIDVYAWRFKKMLNHTSNSKL